MLCSALSLSRVGISRFKALSTLSLHNFRDEKLQIPQYGEQSAHERRGRGKNGLFFLIDMRELVRSRDAGALSNSRLTASITLWGDIGANEAGAQVLLPRPLERDDGLSKLADGA